MTEPEPSVPARGGRRARPRTRRAALIRDDVAVHAELTGQTATLGAEALPEDLCPDASFLAGSVPGHEERAVRVHRYCRVLLGIRGEAVHEELAPLGRPRAAVP